MIARIFAMATLETDIAQGSTWVYQSYVEPYFRKNEANIDKAIADAQTQTVTFMQSRLAIIWETVIGLLNNGAGRQQPQSGTPGAPGGSGQPASGGASNGPATPAAPWIAAAQGLWSAYGPAVMGAINRGGQASAASTAQAASGQRPPSDSSTASRPATSPTTSRSAASPTTSRSAASFPTVPSSPPVSRGTSSGYRGYQTSADPRQVPLPPSGWYNPHVFNLQMLKLFLQALLLRLETLRLLRRSLSHTTTEWSTLNAREQGNR
jgi:hypothetical protein